jgi:hypothetical protein
LCASLLRGGAGFDSRTTPTLSDLQAVIIAQMQKKLKLGDLSSSINIDELLGVIIIYSDMKNRK